jgi:hypothetical protein
MYSDPLPFYFDDYAIAIDSDVRGQGGLLCLFLLKQTGTNTIGIFFFNMPFLHSYFCWLLCRLSAQKREKKRPLLPMR